MTAKRNGLTVDRLLGWTLCDPGFTISARVSMTDSLIKAKGGLWTRKRHRHHRGGKLRVKIDCANHRTQVRVNIISCWKKTKSEFSGRVMARCGTRIFESIMDLNINRGGDFDRKKISSRPYQRTFDRKIRTGGQYINVVRLVYKS